MRDTSNIVDEALEGNLRYTETLEANPQGPVRTCALHLTGADKPVSSMRVYGFEQRFGAVAVSVEGIGAVNTNPDYRRRGYASQLMRLVLKSASTRVDAMFLFGIRGFYGSFGFTPCLADSSFSLWLKNAAELFVPEDFETVAIAKDDIPRVVPLFNAHHRERPWTLVRDEGLTAGLAERGGNRPGAESFILRDQGRIRGYAIVEERRFGWLTQSFRVMEALADSCESARGVISVLRDLGLRCGVDTITIREPGDSVVGRTLRMLGAELRRSYRADGGAMGVILNRESLVDRLAPELQRRAGEAVMSPQAVEALAKGGVAPDSGNLLKLLLGYWSWDDAEHAGEVASDDLRPTMVACFPGGGTPRLLEAYSHDLDRY